MIIQKAPKAQDRSPTTKTVGTSYTTGGTGGTGWVSGSIDTREMTVLDLLLLITKAGATVMTLKAEVSDDGVTWWEQWKEGATDAVVHEVPIPTTSLGATHRIKLPWPVPANNYVRFRAKATTAADGSLELHAQAARSAS